MGVFGLVVRVRGSGLSDDDDECMYRSMMTMVVFGVSCIPCDGMCVHTWQIQRPRATLVWFYAVLDLGQFAVWVKRNFVENGWGNHELGCTA